MGKKNKNLEGDYEARRMGGEKYYKEAAKRKGQEDNVNKPG